MPNNTTPKKQKYILFIKLLILCLSWLLFTGVCMANQKEETCLEFSLTKFEAERNIISNFVGIPDAYTKIIKAYVATYDLNEDGTPEIFTHIEGGGFLWQPNWVLNRPL